MSILTSGYLKALLSGLTPKFERVESGLSNAQIYELVSSLDPEFAAKFSANDTYRLQKWFDIYSFLRSSGCGEAPSSYLCENTLAPVASNLAIFELSWDRGELRGRIKERTRAMFEQGLLDEARELFARYPQRPKPLNSVGLKECGEFLRGEIKTQTELEELICTHTAQLAKRQRTFNRSQFESKFSGSVGECEEKIIEFLKG